MLCHAVPMEIERCKICNANLALVGRSHRCVPIPVWAGGVEKKSRKRHDGGAHSGAATDDGRKVEAGGIPKGPATATNSKREFRKPLAKDAAKTLAATKPWELQGMSRRTWYRRQKEDKE